MIGKGNEIDKSVLADAEGERMETSANYEPRDGVLLHGLYSGVGKR